MNTYTFIHEDINLIEGIQLVHERVTWVDALFTILAGAVYPNFIQCTVTSLGQVFYSIYRLSHDVILIH